MGNTRTLGVAYEGLLKYMALGATVGVGTSICEERTRSAWDMSNVRTSTSPNLIPWARAFQKPARTGKRSWKNNKYKTQYRGCYYA